MEITRQADYAIRCVLEAARHERISAAEIARRQELSPSFVAKLVGTLARAEILETRRGAAGGVRLGRPPEEITLLEVIEAVQGPVRINLCARSPAACGRADTCPVAPAIREAQDALVTALSVSFGVLIAAEQRCALADRGTPSTVVSPSAAEPAGTGR